MTTRESQDDYCEVCGLDDDDCECDGQDWAELDEELEHGLDYGFDDELEPDDDLDYEEMASEYNAWENDR